MSTMHELWVVGQEFQRAPEARTLDGDADSESELLEALLSEDPTAIQRALIGGAPVGLCEAALLGDAVRVRRLLAAGADPFPDDGWSPLHLGAWAGRTPIVEALLEEAVPVDLPAGPVAEPYGCTALHLAVARGHRAVVALLLEAGAYVDRQDAAGWTPLHQAADRGDLEMVKLLVGNGAKVNVLCADTTPLGMARRAGHHSVVALLKQVGGTA